MQESSYIKPIPGITDISSDQAMAEFLFVNNLVTKGEFLTPREGMLSKLFVNMPPSFAGRIIIGRDVDGETDGQLFIGLDEDMANSIFPLDFSIVVNHEYFAFSVNAINSNFIVRLPILPDLCRALVEDAKSKAIGIDTSITESTATPAEDDFLAELEAEAKAVAAMEVATDLKINVRTFVKTFGSDFGFKRSASSSRLVPISISDAQLSIN